MNHWFFLSYARNNLNDYLRRFYRDLNKTIRDLTDRGEGGEGFFDTRDIEVGRPWPDVLCAALQNSRAFISLYSPAYFDSEYCGKEWQIFSSRQAAYSATLPPHAARPSLMLPVLWVPEAKLPKPLPDAVATVQYKHSDFGEVYAQEGLRQLMVLSSKYRTHYRAFLTAFANKLIQAVGHDILPPDPHPLPLDRVENAFLARRTEGIKAAEAPVNVDPRSVHFIFVAGRRDELRTVREKLDAYGDEGGCDWHPFLPEHPYEVGITAQGVATNENLRYVSVPLDSDISGLVKAAERANRIVAILVDTWTLRIPRYQALIEAYNDVNSVNCVVLAPLNSKDDETKSHWSALFSWVHFIFVNHHINHPNCFSVVNSHDEMEKKLIAALHQARSRLIKKAVVLKTAFSEQVISKPIITGNRRASA